MDAESSGNRFALGAIVSGCLAVVFMPLVLGPLALALSGYAMFRRQPMANAAMCVALGGTCLGLLIFALVIRGTSS